MTGQALHGRRGAVFCVRLTEEERSLLERDQAQDANAPRALGPFLVWRATGAGGGSTRAPVLPARVGNTALAAVLPPPAKRWILDLCAGTGAWSEPYRRAGYRVVRVSLPKYDVRTFAPPRSRVWGVLAAPPCDEFSLVRNGSRKPRDFARGLECVNACMRIILQVRPTWWALENPVGKLSTWLGTPRDVFEPCDFGDPWTKRTAIWGDFALPKRGPYVKPARGLLHIAKDATERARTPAGFARAFFEANP